MLGTSLIILFGVLGVLIVFGVITNVLQSAGRAWKLLSERYPPAARDPEAQIRRYQIYVGSPGSESVFQRRPPGCLWILMPWTITRGIQEALIIVDDEHLHLERTGGPGVNQLPISIPWGEVEFGPSYKTHLGEYATLLVAEVQLNVPLPAVERELEVRQAMQPTGLSPAGSVEGFDEGLRIAREHGIDVSQPHPVSFYLYFRQQQDAENAANRLRNRYSIRTRPPGDGIENWSVIATRTMMPLREAIMSESEQLEALAMDYNGEYDGWEVTPSGNA